MKNFRTISTGFWDDSKVRDEFTPEDKYFYLYILTNPYTNLAGCFEISNRAMEQDTGYNAETIARLIRRMEQHNVIRYDRRTKEILILNWGKYNWSKSDKLQKAVLSVAQYIKNPKFRQFVISSVNAKCFGKEIEEEIEKEIEVEVEKEIDTDSVLDVSIGYGYGIDTVSAPKKKRFSPPTVEEVSSYCKEKGYTVDPERFVAYYESNGWMVGKNKMKDWKAAVQTWASNGYSNTKPKDKNGRTSGYDMDSDEIAAIHRGMSQPMTDEDIDAAMAKQEAEFAERERKWRF